MRLPRLRFTVRRLMVVVAVVALALGYGQARRRWARYRIEAAYHAYWEAVCREVAAADERQAEQGPIRGVASELVRQATEKRQEAAEHAKKRRDFESKWW